MASCEIADMDEKEICPELIKHSSFSVASYRLGPPKFRRFRRKLQQA
jgi:hypothetical protein